MWEIISYTYIYNYLPQLFIFWAAISNILKSRYYEQKFLAIPLFLTLKWFNL